MFAGRSRYPVMAKTPPAPAAAPVLDDRVDMPVEGEASPSRIKWRLPRLALRMPAFVARLPMPKIALSKKMAVIIAGSLVGVASAGAAAYAFWPAEPERPHTPAAKKAKKPKHAASQASAAVAASAASQTEPAAAAASSPAVASPEAAASGPEEAMDKLRRRLGEVMGPGGALQADGPGELRLTARAASAPAAEHRAARPTLHHQDDAVAQARGEALGEHPAPHGHDAAPSHLHWSYDGLAGPEAWGKLKPEYSKCATGARQSPIDIRDGIQVKLDAVKFEYQPSRFGVIDNGHTVQVNVAPGNFIEVMGRRFELQQFHFHRPSEERIAGRQFDMAAHLVHKDADGKLAVIAVLLEHGGAQPVVQAVWNNLPLEKGEEQPAQVPIDLNQLLPADRSYYTYMGSLTTPPCTEGVLWMVMKRSVPLSDEQLAIFARLYPMNARPIQSASGRLIKESE